MFGKLRILPFLGVLLLFLSNKICAQIGPINDSAITTSSTKPLNNDSSNSFSRVEKEKPHQTDSLHLKHSPKKATILSVFIPGAGQVYNRKYWKVPIIYAAAGASLYAALWNNKYYQNFKREYKIRLDNGISEDEYYKQFQTPTLESYRNYYHQNRDLSYILLGACYILQIVDAAVDAHFYDFTISEDLSIHVQPQLYWVSNQTQTHLLFTIKF
jgi:hypothetical protein